MHKESTKIHRGYFWLIFGLILLFHLLTFREVLFSIPSIWQGEEVLVREELVPFFDFQTQFFDQILGEQSELTSTV